MAATGTLTREGASRRIFPRAIPPYIWTIASGIALGYLVLTISERPVRWLLYTLAGLVVIVFALITRARRLQLITLFIIGLSLNLHFYITQPEQLLFLGISSPTYFSIPFVLLPGLTLGFWMIADAIAGRIRLSWGLPVSKFGACIIATALISAQLSTVRRYGLYAVVEMLQYLTIYLVTVNVIRSKEDVRLIIRLLLATLAIQCTVFLIQTATGSIFTLTGEVQRSSEQGLVRASGTVGVNPESYALFIEPIVFTAYALWRTREAGTSGAWTACLSIVGGATLILTLDRTAWVTLPLGLSVVEIVSRKRGIARKLPGTTRLSILGIVVLSATLMIPMILPRLHQNHGDDWKTRQDLMRIAIRMIAGNPIVGVGPGAYAFHLREYLPPDVGNWLWVVHNEFLLVWAERGLLGFAAWLAWIRSGFRQAVLASSASDRYFQAFGIGCVAGIVGLLWEEMLNAFPSFCCYALLWCLFGILVAGNDIYAKSEYSQSAGVESPDLQPRRATA